MNNSTNLHSCIYKNSQTKKQDGPYHKASPVWRKRWVVNLGSQNKPNDDDHRAEKDFQDAKYYGSDAMSSSDVTHVRLFDFPSQQFCRSDFSKERSQEEYFPVWKRISLVRWSNLHRHFRVRDLTFCIH